MNFPLRMIPWLSPDAKHPGWRLRRRARSTTAPSSSSAFLSATVGTNSIPSVKQYPLNGSRGRSPLVRGFGGRTGPCFVSLGALKCPFIQLTSFMFKRGGTPQKRRSPSDDVMSGITEQRQPRSWRPLRPATSGSRSRTGSDSPGRPFLRPSWPTGLQSRRRSPPRTSARCTCRAPC